MKILKIIGIGLIALILIVLGLGLVIPKAYTVARSVVIDKPRSEVFTMVSTLRNQEKWSPWIDYDPQVKVTYTGADGAVGSTYTWAGNDDIGKGEQEIKAITPNEMVHNEVRFQEPFASVGQVYFILADEGKATKVTWKMEGEQVYPMNVMAPFMDGMLGKEFAKGLIKLKTLTEK
ncbi:hypothetical protein GCM10028803_50030 [Larkinella knui]|uniref:Polyketide cyclase n=1 Tax=Larkinella knui TaxID=2025310 RepID=A0A3P1CQN1_9BACT|nr:SRPBCC family protein [Larkinella knui]RRB15569.1 polyketide cyclase [Larkinella knui]